MAKKKHPANPYNRLLTTAEAASEIGYNVNEGKLRQWRMDADHPLQYYKKNDKIKSHCFYKWEDICDFKSAIEAGDVII